MNMNSKETIKIKYKKTLQKNRPNINNWNQAIKVCCTKKKKKKKFFKGKLKRRRNASSVNRTITTNMNSKETIKNTLQKN